jgi:hypothetical protein
VALLVAAGWSDVFSRIAWRRIGRAMSLWTVVIRGTHVPHGTLEARLACCKGCPLWYSPLQTCGSPFKKGAEDLGCWCFMPQKAKYDDAVCWMDLELGDDAKYSWRAFGVDDGPTPEHVTVTKSENLEHGTKGAASDVPLNPS